MTKTVLITGTSTGLGRATAKHFLAQGWNVVATMRTPDQESEFTQSERTLVTRLDVEDTNSIHSAVEAGLSKFGCIDVLVNNAGYGVYGPLEATSPNTMRRQFNVNVLGLLTTIQALLPHFRTNQGARLLTSPRSEEKLLFLWARSIMTRSSLSRDYLSLCSMSLPLWA